MLSLYKPNYDDLWFRQKMLADKETMSYNHAWGGTISFTEEKWEKWYDNWILNHDNNRYYRYLQNEHKEFIGEIAYHFDKDIQGYIASIIIYSPFRRKGYGKQGLNLLCDAARNNGISVLYDDIAIDNPAIKLFLDNGFIEEFKTKEKVILKKEL